MECVLCKRCQLSKSFSARDKPKKIDFKNVSNTSNNHILKEIIDHGIGNVGDKFTVIAFNNRYRITIHSKSKKYVILKQEYMHFDKLKGYIPINLRFVRLSF